MPSILAAAASPSARSGGGGGIGASASPPSPPLHRRRQAFFVTVIVIFVVFFMGSLKMFSHDVPNNKPIVNNSNNNRNNGASHNGDHRHQYNIDLTREKIGHSAWTFMHAVAQNQIFQNESETTTASASASSKQQQNSKLQHDLRWRFDELRSLPNSEKMALMIWLIGDLFPCDECSTHFRSMMLDESFAHQLISNLYPLETNDDDDNNNSGGSLLSTSSSATGNRDHNEIFSKFLCTIHNKVNERKEKPQFDCSMDALDRRWKMKST